MKNIFARCLLAVDKSDLSNQRMIQIKKSFYLPIAYCLLLIAFTISCKNDSKPQVDADIYYSCSMDPQVVEYAPGKCPICKMELTPIKKGSTSAPDEIQLSDQQIELGNIHSMEIEKGLMGDQITYTATLNFDQDKINTVSARVMGRIDRLFVKSEGEYVNKGDRLYEIYSEDLGSAKQDYLLALEKKATLGNTIIDFNTLVQASKNKLLLWGLTENQINDLEKNKSFSPHSTFFSPYPGYVTAIETGEGQYTMEGSPVIKLASLSTLWAEVQVYASDVAKLNNYPTATLLFPDFPDKKIEGKLEFVNPELVQGSRLNLARISIANPGGQFKPGMPVFVVMKGKSKSGIKVPIDAVIRDDKMTMVWVQTGDNTFKRKMVMTGMEVGNEIEILSGLKETDNLVITGSYLINSEYIFKKGHATATGHIH